MSRVGLTQFCKSRGVRWDQRATIRHAWVTHASPTQTVWSTKGGHRALKLCLSEEGLDQQLMHTRETTSRPLKHTVAVNSYSVERSDERVTLAWPHRQLFPPTYTPLGIHLSFPSLLSFFHHVTGDVACCPPGSSAQRCDGVRA